MTDLREERCGTCRHWCENGAPLSAAARHGHPGKDLGTCQIGTPFMFEVNGFPVGVWPETPATRFCGEWEGWDEDGDGPDGGEEVTPTVEGRQAVPAPVLALVA